MQKLIMIMLCLIGIAASIQAQRADVPEKNDNNEVDLKVVFQNYVIETTHYSQFGGMRTSYEKGKYLLMKVNGLYLKGADTGIEKGVFQKYLGNCPRSLDLGLEGLRNYKTSDRSSKLQWLSYATGIVGGVFIGKYLLEGENERSVFDRNLGIGLVTGGVATYYAFGYRSKRYEELGDQRIVDAFDLYRKDCFVGDLEDPKYYADGLENGDSNENEKVELEILTNNPSPSYFMLGPYGLVRYDNGLYADGGLSLQMGVKDIGINIKAAKSFSPSFDFDALEGEAETQYYVEALATIPLIKKEKEKSGSFKSADSNGRNFTIKTTGVKYLSSFGVDGGVELSKGYSTISENRNLFLHTNRRIRAGLSLTNMSETSFKILDNRFPDIIYRVFTNSRFYVHALMDAGSDIEIAPKSSFFGSVFIPDEIPDRPQVGFVGGLETLNNGGGFGAVTLRIEAGLYPAANEISGFGVQIGLGFLIGRVSR